MYPQRFLQYFLTILSIGLTQVEVQGQSALIRAEQHSLPLIKDSLKLINSLNRLGALYRTKNADSCFYYGMKAKSMATRLAYPKGQTDANNVIALALFTKGLFKESLELFSKVLPVYQKESDTAKIVQVIANMARVYRYMDNYAQTKTLYHQAIHIGSKLKNDSIMSQIYIHYSFDQSSDDSVGYYLDRSQKIATQYEDTQALIGILQIKAQKLLNKGQKEKALLLIRQALSESRKENLELSEMSSLGLYSAYFYYKNMPDSSLKYARHLYKIAKEKGYIYQRVSILKAMLTYTQLAGNKDSIISIHRLLETEMLTENDNQKKFIGDYVKYSEMRDDNASLELTNKSNKTRIWLLIGVCGISVLLIIAIYRLYQVSRRNGLEQVQLNGKINEQYKQINEQNRGLHLTLDTLRQSQEDNMHMIKTVAHDLRGPMAATVSLVSLLLENKSLGSEDSEMLELMKDTNLHSLEMTENLLNMNTSFENMEMEAVAIDTLLNYCVKMMTFKAAEKKQKVILQTIEVSIQGNREKLWRLFGNLITNAIKFSPVGSTINVDMEKNEQSIQVRIADNGIGIPREIQGKIFDLFTDAKREGTSGEQSFGLGLAISKQIVEAHHGRIWLKSEPDMGTTFYIELPHPAYEPHI
jgi:signal transduction histidine kinase